MTKCPKCGSTNIHADKKGFGVKKSLVGGVLIGGVGLLAGVVGSNKIRLTCLDCGFEFKPGDKAPNGFMENYTPIVQVETPIAHDNTPTAQRVAPKSKGSQRAKIETLLKYRDVIANSKVSLLEAMLEEGQTFVIVPNGEIDILSKLQRESNPIKRIVSFQEYKD